MNLKKLAQRNSTLDIIRIVAVFTVVSVHFFLHNGFYSEPISGYPPIEGLIRFFSSGDAGDLHGLKMFIMVTMRTFFGVCVPLFMILTGWLMSKKTLSRSYYKGIRKTLIVFALASVFCMLFKSVHTVPDAQAAFLAGDFDRMLEAIARSGQFDFKHYLLSIFDFTGANYSWYIEMYIGLFLIAPFLNLAYHKLGSKRHKQILILTFLFITVIPTAFNIFNFDTSTWWTTPTESDTFQKLLPGFWMGVYPITYYFTGMYLREYGLKLRARTVGWLLAGSLLLFSAFNIFRSSGVGFKTGLYGYWYGFSPYVLSVLLFVLLSRIKTDTLSDRTKLILWKVSDLALGAYLMSYVSDELIYPQLRTLVPVMVDRLPFYFVTVPLSFLCAMAMSALINALATLIIKAYERIKAFIIAERRRPNGLIWQDILFLVLFGTVAVVSVWKLKFGFGGNDEAFYLTIPHRLSKGDGLFIDEWHLSQLSGFLLLPFVWLFTLITGSTTGILLSARVFYLIVHGAASVLIYSRLRKRGIFSVFGSVFYFLFTPYNIMALSYDSMGLELVILTGVLLACADYDKKLWVILSGLCFAGAVLCNPYLMVGYVLYLILMAVHLAIRNKETKFALKSRMFAPKTVLWFTVGAAALAVVFFIFTFLHTGFGDIFKNLPYMLKDPEHAAIPLTRKFTSYFEFIYKSHDLLKYVLLVFGAMMAALIFDKKRRLHRAVYLTVAAALSIFTLILYLPNVHYSTYNAIMFPMIFVSITAYILCKDKPRELFVGLFCLGVLYSFCIHCTSNQYFYIISVALTAANLAGFIFLGQLVKEMRESPDNLTYAVPMRWVSLAAVALLVVLQGCFQLSAKVQHVFWEQAPENLTAQITDGPAKGIYTTAGNAESYRATYEDLQIYKEKAPGNILFMTKKTYTYLAADLSYGTYSAWLSGENNLTLQRLREFYELNPDKIPKYIYIPKDSDWDIGAIIREAQQNGYTLTETAVSYQLEK